MAVAECTAGSISWDFYKLHSFGGVTNLSIQSLFFSWLLSRERWGTSPRRVARSAVPGGVMFSWAFIHFKYFRTNWKADRSAKSVTDIDGHIEYITFAKEYGSKKGQTHPTWRRVVCNYEQFKNDIKDGAYFCYCAHVLRITQAMVKARARWGWHWRNQLRHQAHD